MKPHERLDQAMRARRVELGLEWKELAVRAQISPEALRAIRRGDFRPRDLTARSIDRAFKWTPGSVEVILDGGEPTPLVDREVHVEDSVHASDEVATRTSDDFRETVEALREEVAALRKESTELREEVKALKEQTQKTGRLSQDKRTFDAG